MLICTIIVTGDGARADIHVIAYLGVSEIGEMPGFRAFTQTRLFNFDKVADVRAFQSSAPWRNRANGPMVQAAAR